MRLRFMGGRDFNWEMLRTDYGISDIVLAGDALMSVVVFFVCIFDKLIVWYIKMTS